MADSQLFEILIIAAVAAVILFRLYTVLGRRTGNEQPPQELRFPEARQKQLPDSRAPETHTDHPRPVDASPSPVSDAAGRLQERPADAVASGLFDISVADRAFHPDSFLTGARSAYEMIETAFAEGDRAALQPLLSAEVFAAFDAVIREREARGRKCVFTFVGFKETKIVAAALKDRMAEITVLFAAQFISYVVDAGGVAVEGDDRTVREVRDVWTFSRPVQSRDPNWTLIATASEA